MIHGDGLLADAIRHNLDCPDWLEWAAWDTPIFGNGQADYVSTRHEIQRLCDVLPKGQTVAISSQVHVGTHTRLARWYPALRFASVPKNIRANHAVTDWAKQDRVVYGSTDHDPRLIDILGCWTERLLLTDPETAEFTKHALNGFLAMSVQYANEIAILAEKVGADAEWVAEALRADRRIGNGAYLRPVGSPGKHLTREIHTLHFMGGGPLIDRLRGVQ